MRGMLTQLVHRSVLAAFALATVAVAQNTPVDGSFQVRYAANLTTQVPGTIYSTDGVPPTFSAFYYGIQTAPSPGCAVSSFAMQFTAVTTGPLQQIILPVFNLFTPAVTTATFELSTDVANAPGVLIESLTFTGVSAFPGANLTATSTLNPILTAGTVYWLKAIPPPCGATIQGFGWAGANPFVAGNYSINGVAATPAPTGLATFALTTLVTPDSAVNFTNTGANNAQDICVNTYTFSPDEQLVSCCACRVTRNALWSLGVRRDLTSNTLTPGVEKAVAIKLLATAAPAAGPCNPANPGPRVQGLAAWGTTVHAANLTTGPLYFGETPFTNSTLSASELAVMTSFCGFIQANGSGFGICRSCQGAGGGRIPIGSESQNTALGADRQ